MLSKPKNQSPSTLAHLKSQGKHLLEREHPIAWQNRHEQWCLPDSSPPIGSTSSCGSRHEEIEPQNQLSVDLVTVSVAERVGGLHLIQGDEHKEIYFLTNNEAPPEGYTETPTPTNTYHVEEREVIAVPVRESGYGISVPESLLFPLQRGEPRDHHVVTSTDVARFVEQKRKREFWWVP